VVQWLRDELGLLATAAESEALARRAKPAEGLYIVPALRIGRALLAADARGAIVGLHAMRAVRNRTRRAGLCL
jgi:glycerol kinase